jgi:hypothetical protein
LRLDINYKPGPSKRSTRFLLLLETKGSFRGVDLPGQSPGLVKRASSSALKYDARYSGEIELGVRYQTRMVIDESNEISLSA